MCTAWKPDIFVDVVLKVVNINVVNVCCDLYFEQVQNA